MDHGDDQSGQLNLDLLPTVENILSSFDGSSVTELEPFKSLLGTEDIVVDMPEIRQPCSFLPSPKWQEPSTSI